MEIFFTNRFIPPSRDILPIMEQELAAGNPLAALYKSVLLQSGEECGLPIGTQMAIDVVRPFVESNIYCAARYALLRHASARRNNQQRDEAQKILDGIETEITKLAEEDSYLAFFPAGAIYSLKSDRLHDEVKEIFAKRKFNPKMLRQIADKHDRNARVYEALSEKYYRRGCKISDEIGKAAAEQAKGFNAEEKTFYGCTYSLHHLKLVLNDKAYRLTGDEAKALYAECIALDFLGAKRGNAAAQRDMGRRYLNVLRNNPPAQNGKAKDLFGSEITIEEFEKSLVEYLSSAKRQGFSPAGHELAQYYEFKGDIGRAIELYEELLEHDYVDVGFDLAILLDQQGRYADAYDLFFKHAETGHIPSIFKVADYAYAGRTDRSQNSDEENPPAVISPNPRVAYQASSILIRDAKQLSLELRQKLTAMRDSSLARSWVGDDKGSYRRAQLKDHIYETEPWVCSPEDPAEVLTFFRDLAGLIGEDGKPAANVSLDLALELAGRYADGIGLEQKDVEEALRWCRHAADAHKSSIAMVELVVHSENLVEALIYSHRLLSTERLQGPSLNGEARRRIQSRQKEIYAEGTEEPPRVWVPREGGAMRPVTPADKMETLANAVLVPADPVMALAWYEEAARNGSAEAVAIAARIHDKMERDTGAGNALAMLGVAADGGSIPAALEAARRYQQADANEDLAFLSYLQAAELGSLTAITEMAWRLQNGSPAHPQDLIEALRWCQRGLAKEGADESDAELRAVLSTIQTGVLSPENGLPPVWMLDEDAVFHPMTPGSDLDNAVILPHEEQTALAWLDAAADESPEAAMFANKTRQDIEVRDKAAKAAAEAEGKAQAEVTAMARGVDAQPRRQAEAEMRRHPRRGQNRARVERDLVTRLERDAARAEAAARARAAEIETARRLEAVLKARAEAEARERAEAERRAREEEAVQTAEAAERAPVEEAKSAAEADKKGAATAKEVVEDTWTAKLDEAERLSQGGLLGMDGQASYNLLAQVFEEHPDLPNDAIDRIINIRKALLPFGWQLASEELVSAKGVIYSAEGSVHPDLKFDEQQPLFFFPPNYESLLELLEYSDASADAAGEVAHRLAHNIGGEEAEPATALSTLSIAMVDPAAVGEELRYGIVPANSPAREKMLALWDEVAPIIEVRGNRRTGEYVFTNLTQVMEDREEGFRDESKFKLEEDYFQALENFLVKNYQRIGRPDLLIVG